MIKSTFLLVVLVSFIDLNAQYTYRGRAFKSLTGEAMSFGEVRVRMGTPRESRLGTTIAHVDSLGYFSIILSDSADVWIVVYCGLEGYDYKTVTHSDTLIIFNINASCNTYNVETAKRDIKDNKLHLIYNGILSDLPLSHEDEAFQKKYNVQYINFLDAPEWEDCIRLYNGEIGRFLDEKFGKSWRKEVKNQIEFY